MAKFEISHSIEIDQPAETVFQYVTDVSQAHDWRPNLSIKEFSGEPFGVGTTWREVTNFMGRDMEIQVEVTELEAGRHCKMKQEGGPVSGSVTWDIRADTADSCTARLSFDGEISGWLAGLASGMLRGQAQKAMERDLGNVKSNLEAS